MLMGRHFIDRRRTRIKNKASPQAFEWYPTLASLSKGREIPRVRLINTSSPCQGEEGRSPSLKVVLQYNKLILKGGKEGSCWGKGFGNQVCRVLPNNQ